MDLRWPAVLVVGVVCLAACVALAGLMSMPPVRRRLRRLAHIDRLTRLPEYARLVRRQWWSMIVTVALLTVVLLAALVAGARPMGPSATDRSGHAAAPEDVMLCVGAPLTDPVTAGFVNYFAREARTDGPQRIGLTSATLRVVPLTLDHRFAADRFSQLAALAATQQRLDANRPIPEAELSALRTGLDEFTRSPDYLDYAPSVADTLALCMAGFPAETAGRQTRRSLIYLGDSSIRDVHEARPPLFSIQQVKELAAPAGIQVNVISRSDRPGQVLRGADSLSSIAAATGGSFEINNAVGTEADTAGGTSPSLTASLNEIRATPPPPKLTRGDGASVTADSSENPAAALLAAGVAALLLSSWQVGARR